MSPRLLASIGCLTLIAAAPAPSSRTVLLQGGRATPAWFVCDPTDGSAIVVFENRGEGGTARANVFPRSAPRTARTTTYRVGDGDPGAGQIYYALKRDGREAGSVHAVNPGVFDPETPVRLPAISSLEMDGVRTQCRLIPGAVFIGFTQRRSLAVVSTKAGLAYRTFDFSQPSGETPSTDVNGGRGIKRGGGVEYRFDTKGFTYLVKAPATGAATLSVLRAGRLVQSEPLIAYSAVR
ncbi:hypothetical protein BH09PSE2_BH09PSE2_06390 [soil metagenome]